MGYGDQDHDDESSSTCNRYDDNDDDDDDDDDDVLSNELVTASSHLETRREVEVEEGE